MLNKIKAKTVDMNIHYIPVLSKFVLVEGKKLNGRTGIKGIPLDIFYIDTLWNMLGKYEEIEKMYPEKIKRISDLTGKSVEDAKKIIQCWDE